MVSTNKRLGVANVRKDVCRCEWLGGYCTVHSRLSLMQSDAGDIPTLPDVLSLRLGIEGSNAVLIQDSQAIISEHETGQDQSSVLGHNVTENVGCTDHHVYTYPTFKISRGRLN